jgi:hypothetical protein
MLHRKVAQLVGLGLLLAAPLSLSAASANPDGQPVSAALSRGEIDQLTTLGPVPDDVTPEQLEAAWQAKWGLPDIGVVPDRLTEVAANFPGADGGLTYDPSTLTYTEWVVEGSPFSKVLRAKVQEAFGDVASGSNIKLAFAQTRISLVDGLRTIDQLVAAAKTDSWPQGVQLTGDWIIENGTVTDALRAAAESHPASDAGLTYDPGTLTYTQWLVKDAATTTALRAAAQEAFESAAADSNLALRFATSTASVGAAQAVLDQLTTAARTDPDWPNGLALTGDWSPEQGKFVLDAGGRANDLAARAYFERHWPGLVALSPKTPATPQ